MGIGPLPVRREETDAGNAPEHEKRIRAVIERRPHITWQPGHPGLMGPSATWLEVDTDPRADGTTVRATRETLAELADYLEARFRP